MTNANSLVEKIQDLVKDLYHYWSLGIGMSYLTNHDFKHCSSIFSLWTEFVSKNKNIGISELEEQILIISFYLHDIGCVISRHQHQLLSYIEMESFININLSEFGVTNLNQDEKEIIQLATIVSVLHNLTFLKILVYDSSGNIKSSNDIHKHLLQLFTSLKENIKYQNNTIRLHILGGLLSLFDALDDTKERINNEVISSNNLIFLLDDTINNYIDIYEDFKKKLVKFGSSKFTNTLNDVPLSANDVYNSWHGDGRPYGSRYYWVGLNHIDFINFNDTTEDIQIFIADIKFYPGKIPMDALDGLHLVIFKNIKEDFEVCRDICNNSKNIVFPAKNLKIIYKGQKKNISEISDKLEFKKIMMKFILSKSSQIIN